LIGAPPILSVTDGLLLSPHVTASVYQGYAGKRFKGG
jgi:hypothetical protein